MHRCPGKKTATRDAIRSIRADEDLGSELTLIRFHSYTVFVRENLLDCNALSNLYSSSLCFSRQPGIKFITPDDSQSMPAWNTHVHSPCLKIKMNALSIHMRDFAHIQTEPLKNNLGVDDQSTRAKFGPRITRFFQDQDAGCKSREVARNMKSRGESAGTSTNDNNVTLEHDTKCMV